MLQSRDGKVVRSSLIALADIPDGGAAEVEAELDGERQSLILTRDGQSVSAFLNICPHAGRRLDWALGQFLFDRGDLVCAAHGARFRPEDGACLGGPCRGTGLRAVAVRIRSGRVCLDQGEPVQDG